ncbi:MAG: tol-pal system protein YbgF [Nitrospinae bacterium]|nr:tol-pal system protein YbgF [Nitrospinota bacterium]
MIKRLFSFSVLFFAVLTIGCASDKTLDILKQDVAHLKTQVTDIQKTATEAEIKISGLENRLQNMEDKSKDLENQVFNLSAKIEEGPEIELPAEPAEAALPPQPEAKEIPPPPKEAAVKPEISPEEKKENELKKLAALPPEELYKRAYDHFIFGEYDKAVSAFQIFLDKHPKHELADNSQYWIGECYYAKKDYNTAIFEFRKVADKYPKGNKTPDALLKIGYAYHELGDKKSALKELNNLIKKFPKIAVAKLAKEKIKSIEKAK